jgi:hypothetical protein
MPAKAVILAILGVLTFSMSAGAEDQPVTRGERMYLGLEPLESCVSRWDPGTNMSKEEWRASCKRVADERGTYLRKQGVVPAEK